MNSGNIATNSANIATNTRDIAINRGGIAAVAALSAAIHPDLEPGESGIGVGIGHFEGETALAFDWIHRIYGADGEGRSFISFGIASDFDESTVYKAGIGWKISSKKKKAAEE